MIIRRTVRYSGSRHKKEIEPTKRKKVRVIDFCDTLADILWTVKREQHKNCFQYGELYQRNYYSEVRKKNRIYHKFYHFDGTQEIPDDYTEIFLLACGQMGVWNFQALLKPSVEVPVKSCRN